MEYKGISFARGWTGSFADFRKEFENTWVFRQMEKNLREREMKTVYKDLIKDSKSIEKQKSDGDTSGASNTEPVSGKS